MSVKLLLLSLKSFVINTESSFFVSFPTAAIAWLPPPLTIHLEKITTMTVKDFGNLLILAQEYLLLTLEECTDDEHQKACQMYLDATDSPRFVDRRGNQWVVTPSGIESAD